MPLRSGARLGPYEVLALIGAGGMGEVYKARDTRLDRTVAIKVLPPDLALDPERRRRFEHEARAVSALNHPHICVLYDVGSDGGTDFLVMEYVDGQPLSSRIPSSGLPLSELLRLSIQLSDAVNAAHQRGIVHRDLKPANVMINGEGRVKVLDFGVARLRPQGAGEGDATDTADNLTRQGRAVGTLPYMSPEQLRGQAADARSDIWGLGIVMYEVATGRRPFEGQTAFEVSSAILSGAPAPLPAQIPAELAGVIARCLDKEPARRYQQANEVRAALEAIQTGAVASPATWPGTRSKVQRRVLAWASVAATLVLLTVAAFSLRQLRTRAPNGGSPARIESLAVLPLANLMGGGDQEYYVAAMHEALIAELGQISALTVISRTSVMRYRDTDKAAPDIARELNVDALVEGSMFKAGESLRVQVQLIRARPMERQLWSRTYDGELRNVMGLQKSVAHAIADQIQVTLTPQESARLATRRAVDPMAYDAWAKGSFQFSRLTVESLRKCLEYAAAAQAIDPSYAPAYALTAACQGTLPLIAPVLPGDAFPKAEAAARRALELDEGIADAHFALGWTLATYEWDWSGAEREFRRGLELNPSSALGHLRFGWFLSWLGRDKEALAEEGRAQQLDPTSPNQIHTTAAVYVMARRYDDAILWASRAIEIDPAFAFGYDRLGRAYTEKGMYREAIAALEKAVQLSGNINFKGPLGRAYALAGRRTEARRLLDQLLTLGREGYVNPVPVAMIYIALGEQTEAMRWLQEGYQVRDGNMVVLKQLAAFDPLRSDPRFQDLLRRMKFP